ncbi:MAG: hypothetical protein PHG03_05725 [Bacilli bacterium]|nr:hypothetical protein [Bacilli bacterium]MDD4796031.1 hypothetical protein [Bacilli bacterium]
MFSFKDVYITDYFTIAGPFERKSGIKNCNLYLEDDYYGEKTMEQAEAKMQKTVINNLRDDKTELIVGGDLTNQLTAFALSTRSINIPSMGMYSACATSASSLITLSAFIQSKLIKEGIFITSSHNLAAEKQFRFPVEYGAPKPLRSTSTATAAVGIKLSKTPSKIKIVSATLGKTIDSYIKDAHNMGAVMAIGAVDTLMKHLTTTKTTVKDYNLILTGDLGKVGAEIFKETLKQEHNINIKNHLDAGAEFYPNFEYAGASGTAVQSLLLVTKYIHQKKYKKILFLATGSLHSPVLVNQKNTIPTVTHVLYLEVEK